MNDQTRYEIRLVRRDLDCQRKQLSALGDRLGILENAVIDEPETAVEELARRRREERPSAVPEASSPPPVSRPAVPPPLPVKKPASIPHLVSKSPPKKEALPPKGRDSNSSKESESAEEPPSSFEVKLGAYWFVRGGIVMLLTGLVFLANFAYENWIAEMGPFGKISGLYLISGALMGVGAWLHRRQESLENYAQVLFAGGLAAVYFTTYAAHYYEDLQIIANETLAGLALLAWAGFIVWLANRRKSEVMALFAIGLAYYTASINPTGYFTLFSNAVLTVAAVFFLVRNRWAILSFVSLAGTYGGWAFWRFYHHGGDVWRSGSIALDEYWIGLGFLACYWIVFTAAVFVSRAGEFDEKNRGMFLTANNGLLVALGAITTSLAYPDQFWAFPLTVGVILLGLMAAAKKILPNEPAAENCYLVQGLLLVTWGIMAWFTGSKLALTLGIESVVLIVLGYQRASRFMQAGGFITGGLAVVLALDNIQPFEFTGLMLGASLGALMIFNAWWLNRINLRAAASAGQSDDESVETRTSLTIGETPIAYFSIGGLLLWMVATVHNLSDEGIGPILALTGLGVMLSVSILKIRTLSLLGCAYLVCGQAMGIFQLLESSAPPALWLTATVIAATVAALHWWKEYGLIKLKNDQEEILLGVFSVAICLLLWLATWRHFGPQMRGPILALEALLISLSWYPLRTRLLSLLGGAYLVLAQIGCIVMVRSHPDAVSLWAPLATAAFSLMVLHWWQRQRSVELSNDHRNFLVGLLSLGIVGLLYYGIEPLVSAQAWLALSALLAVAFGAYGILTRTLPLAALGQIFLANSAWQFLVQTLTGHPAWWAALCPVIVLGGYALQGGEWLHRIGKSNPKKTENFTPAVYACSIGVVLLSTIYVYEYFDVSFRFLLLALVGTALFLRGAVDRVKGRVELGSAFVGAGHLLFWMHCLQGGTAHGLDLLAIVLLMGRHLAAVRLKNVFHLDRRHHTAIILSGGASLWLWVTRWSMEVQGGFLMTVAWGGLAFLLIAIGFGLRESEYRRLGIFVLALAMGRVFMIDIWELTLGFRVLSFMGLGLVLITLGYIYNRYQSKIREWI
jgi:uncharacterized membrane protein